MATIFQLQPYFFTEKENLLLEHGKLRVWAFRYASGVCVLRIENALGQVIALPFQGQQIWSAEMRGRNLTMKSTFPEPRASTTYLHNYGAFLVHCGVTAMGGPSRDDTHPLHGELPHAPYNKAYLIVGQDQQGQYIALGGEYQHTIAFNCNYRAEPLFKIYAESSLFEISMKITNLRASEMELMYMAHVNFRPVDYGRLVYSAPPANVHVSKGALVPKNKPEYLKFLDELATHPEKHDVLEPGLPLDPEIVLSIDYKTDDDGWAHSLHIHPDGTADYVRHQPAQLDKGVRWIARTSDEDSLGLVLPSTAEAQGYLAEKAKGHIKMIPPGGEWKCELVAGAVTPRESELIQTMIGRILAN